MPNYVYNKLTFDGLEEDIAKVVDLITTKNSLGHKIIDFQKISPIAAMWQPERDFIPGGDYLLEKCCEQWGTKWNAMDDFDGFDYGLLCFEFNTAWSAPLGVYIELDNFLRRMYPEVGFSFKWADEDMGFNFGIGFVENGEVVNICEDIEGGSREALEAYFEIMDLDISMYDENGVELMD